MRDDTESDDNTAPDGVRADDEQGLVGETVLATQWYYVPKGAAAFAQIKTGDDAGLVEWVAADGTKSTDDTAKASAVGAWVQNIGFGSDWVTTKATIVKDPTDITDQGKVVRIPVVSNGENRADARNKMGVVAVKTYAAGGAQKVVADAKEAAGYKLVDVVDGEYVFDNLPTAVVVLDANSGIDEYFLAAYRVELAAPKNYLKSGYVKGERDPWHITTPHQPVSFADADATAKGLAVDSDVPGTKAGVAGNADELDITDGAIKALYQSWPIQHRYAADGSVRANDGQVILAEVNNGKTDGIQASFADIPVSNAMDTADAATYQWTHPGSDRGGRRRGRDRSGLPRHRRLRVEGQRLQGRHLQPYSRHLRGYGQHWHDHRAEEPREAAGARSPDEAVPAPVVLRSRSCQQQQCVSFPRRDG